MSTVTVVIGAGAIGLAIARRVSHGRHVLLADLNQDNVDTAAGVFADAGFDTSTAVVDASSCHAVHALAEQASSLGDIATLIHAAGVSASQASIEQSSRWTSTALPSFSRSSATWSPQAA